jgi:arylsulfatase A-like enzyme
VNTRKITHAIAISAASLVVACTAMAKAGATNSGPPEEPNIVVVLADDVGFSDFGCYGSEIQTPNIDRLAANGIRFSQFLTENKCNPSRTPS